MDTNGTPKSRMSPSGGVEKLDSDFKTLFKTKPICFAMLLVEQKLSVTLVTVKRNE